MESAGLKMAANTSAFVNSNANLHELNLHEQRIFPYSLIRDNELLRIIAEFSADWIYWVHPNNRIGFVSPSCKYLTGYEPEEMINEIEFWRRIIHPQDLHKLEQHINAVMDGCSICADDFRIIMKNGSVRWISHMCESVFNERDEYIGRYVHNKDITAQKFENDIIFRKGDFVYRRYDNAQVGYYQIYYDGRIKDANKYLINLLGYNSVDEFNHLNFEDYCIVNVDKRTDFKRTLLKNGHVENFESEWIKKDGSFLYLRETAHLVENPDGSYTYYEGIVEDVTDKRQYEEAMLEPAFEKRKAEQLKTEFLAMVSHEIRTPLNVILNFANLLKSDFKKVPAEELGESISIIEKEGKRIQRTIGLMLEMSELQTSTYDFNITEVDLVNDIFLEIYRSYQKEAIEKNIGFSFLNEIGHAKIMGDRYGIYQIFNQLTSNAMKYTMPGGKIIIRLSREDHNIIVVEVSDTGVGIKKEYLPCLFDPFSQEDRGYSRTFEGTGLGLAVVARHCELNGAVIKVESEKDSGTKFTVKFSS